MSRLRTCLSLFLATLAVIIGESYAQEKVSATLLGRVVDMDTGAPVDGAIVFIASSPAGVSSTSDGTFRISNLPLGTYELNALRVGYERELRIIRIEGPESVYVEIKLRPRPVQAPEVEVLADRERVKEPKLDFLFPGFGEGQYCLFPSGESRPIGILFTDSALYMYSLDIVVIDSEKYVWLWLLYRNLTDLPHELDPLTSLSLQVVGSDSKRYRRIRPLTSMEASELEHDVEIRRRISENVERSLNTLVLFQRLIRPGYNRTMARDQDADEGSDADASGRIRIRLDRSKGPPQESITSDYLSTTYKSSFHSGILGRNIVLSDNSIDGIVYFPFPGLHWKSLPTENRLSAANFHYQLEIITPSGSKQIVFSAH